MERPTSGQERGIAFAPSDLTDGRCAYDWQTRYPPEACTRIRWEAAYVVALLLLSPCLMFVIWLGIPAVQLGLSAQQSVAFQRNALAWCGGLLGGALIAMKWLYHTVAHGIWNRDRTWWRLFTPLISAVLAFVLLAATSTFRVMNTGFISRASGIVFAAALIGLFSDNAMAKLAEVAETLFGPVRRRH